MSELLVKKVVIGSDHAGFGLKEILKKYLTSELKLEVLDHGSHDESRCDYPDFGAKVAHTVVQDAEYLGVVVCGSGIGISIAANKVATLD